MVGTGCDVDSVQTYDTPRPAVIVRGAGATVSRALFAKWAEQYAMVEPSTTITYEAAGSGAGVKAALAGIGSARLQIDEDVLADMLMGRTAFWDDPALAALNPGVKLPHIAVRPLYRGDQSGSSYLLAEWLSKTSKRSAASTIGAASLGSCGGPRTTDRRSRRRSASARSPVSCRYATRAC